MFIRELLEASNPVQYDMKVVSSRYVTLKNGIKAFLEMFTISERKTKKVLTIRFSLSWGTDEIGEDFDGSISDEMDGDFVEVDYLKILNVIARKIELSDLDLPNHVGISMIAALKISTESKKFSVIVKDVLGDYDNS